MLVSDGRPILESMVLDYKAWAQYPSVIAMDIRSLIVKA
jgi:hypothetical protein